MKHQHQRHMSPVFDPYLTSHKEDYYYKEKNIACNPEFQNKERGLDRLWAFTSATSGPDKRPTSTYTAHYGNTPSHSFHKQYPVGRPEVSPATTFYQNEAELDRAAQKVFRPTTEYKDQYMGTRPGMRPVSYSGVQFTENFHGQHRQHQHHVPRDQRSSQHRVHDEMPHAHVKNPYLHNPDGTRFASAKHEPISTGIVPSTLPKSAQGNRVVNPPVTRLESTTYGATHSRPFTGVCVHAKPQNYSRPGYAEPYDVNQPRAHPPPPYTDPGYAEASRNYMMKRYQEEYVPIPAVADSIDVDDVPAPPSYRFQQKAPSFSHEFADGARPNMRSPSPPPRPPPPPPAPSNNNGSMRHRSPSPAPVVRSVSFDDNNNNQHQHQHQHHYREHHEHKHHHHHNHNNNNGGNPYGLIPDVHVKRMAAPSSDDPTFDMGDQPTARYAHEPPRAAFSSSNNRATAGRPKQSGSNNNDSGLNLANIESILREADALSKNIRNDVL